MPQPIFKGQGFFFKGRLCAQANRVNEHDEHAIQDGTLVIGFAMPCVPASEGATQQLTSHGHAKTFVLTKGHEGTKHAIGLRHHHHARIVGGMTFFIDQITIGHLLAFVVRDTHLALRHAAGGKVEHEGRAIAHGHANATRVGAKAAIATAKRGDHRTRQHIDKMQRYQTLRDSHFCKVTNATEVMRAAKCHSAHAMLFGAFNAHLHSLHARDLPVATLAV